MQATSPAKPWPASAAELTWDKALGRGFFGEVWACKHIVGKTGQGPVLAVKKVPLSLIRQHNLTAQMDREVEILRTLDHPHIVRMHFDFRDEAHVYLGMEFAAGGGMFDRLSKLGKFEIQPSAQYFYETCDALEYAHGMRIVHRDIKPENILFDAERHVKLADFGWSRVLQEANSSGFTFCGTPDYLAPEMIKGDGHNSSLDMWEMGVLLYEMVIGKSPFGSNSQEQTCRMILRCDILFPNSVDPDVKDLIQKLLKVAPEERLTATQAMAHTFVIKNHAGRLTEVVGPAEEVQQERQSVEVRHLRRKKELLEGELKEMLDGKARLDEQLLATTQELEKAHKLSKAEAKAMKKAQEDLEKREQTEARQQAECEELKRSMETLSTEVSRMKQSTQAV